METVQCVITLPMESNRVMHCFSTYLGATDGGDNKQIQSSVLPHRPRSQSKYTAFAHGTAERQSYVFHNAQGLEASIDAYAMTIRQCKCCFE